MPTPRSFRELSPLRQELVRRLQRTGFGRVEALEIRGGQPVLDPGPRFVREIKFASNPGVPPEADASDFQLKREVVELMLALDQIGNGRIDCLTVKHGLPFGMQLDWPASAA